MSDTYKGSITIASVADGSPGQPGRGITSIDTDYSVSSIGTSAPTTGWSSTFPSSVAEGSYLWIRYTTNYSSGTPTQEVTYNLGYVGTDGTNGSDAVVYSVILSADAVIKAAQSSTYNPSSITATAYSAAGTGTPTYYSGRFKFQYYNGSSWQNGYTSTANSTSYTYTVPTSSVVKQLRVSLYKAGGTTVLLDQQTVPVVSDGLPGDPGSPGTSVTISSSSTSYAVSSSGIVTPSTGWQSTVPSVATGSYLWTRTTVNYSPSGQTVSYSVAYNGTDGGDGNDGNSIESITYYYAATTSNVAPSAASITSTAFPTNFSATNKYVWRKEVIDYSKIADKTTVTLYAIYGDTGRAINQVNEQYAVSSSNSTAPGSTASWSTVPQTLNETNKYLWNYEIISYSDGTNQETTKKVVAIYTTDGTPGKGISEITNWYLATNSTSVTTAASDWSTSMSAVDSTHKYLWNYETVTYTVGEPSNTQPAIIGMYSKDGDDAYSIALTNEAHTFAGNTSQALTATVSFGIVAFKGATRINTSVTNSSITGKVSGLVTSVSNNNSTNNYISVAVSTATALTSQSGILTIPIVADSKTFNKTFSWSVAYTGAQGTSVTEVTEWYKLTNSSTAPSTPATTSTGWASSSIPATSSTSQYLWNCEQITYSTGTVSYTSPHVASKYTADGTPGRGISKITNYYLATESSTAVTSSMSGWTSDIQTTTQDDKYLWNFEKIEYTAAPTTEYTSPAIIGMYAKDGDTGAHGLNVATVYLYQRPNDSAQPAKPTANLTYTFSTGTIANPSPWSQTIPDDNGKPCYVTIATAVSTAATVTISSGSWSTPVKFVESGEDGKERVFVNSSKDKVYKFIENNNVTFSPSSINFWVIPAGQSNFATPVSDYRYKVDLIASGSTSIYDITNYASVATNSQVSVSLTSAAASTVTAIKNAIKDDNACIVFKVYEASDSNYSQKNFLASKPIIVEFGTDENMAKFAVTASAIQAAVDSSKLVFDATGLTIKNGGLKIYGGNDSSNPLLSYDVNATALNIVGSGSFTGNITASSGSFSGTINAASGEIGGWIIGENGLYSKTVSTSTNSSVIQLISGSATDTTNVGRIIAQNIEIGTGAYIQDYLALGSARWLNPEVYNGLILQAGNVTLSQDGILNLGGITIDGANHSLWGENWRIESNWAYFDNINVSGKITSAVFEVNTNTAVGGSMIFKPSYKVSKYDSTNCTVTFETGISGNELNTGDYVYLVKTDGALTAVASVASISISDEECSVILNTNPLGDNSDIIGLIKIGKLPATSSDAKELIIGINSTSNANIIKPRGLTISEFTGVIGNQIQTELKTFLGDLSTSGKQASGYGLYSDNVILNGSLTTKVNTEDGTSYAGINTLSDINSSIFPGEKVVFWAGAPNQTQDPSEAAFHVTNYGSIYATKGRFTDSIISDSIIEASTIKTAIIQGRDDNISPNLQIFNAEYGIGFYSSVGNVETEVFTIGNNGFKIGATNFLTITNGKVYTRFTETKTGNIRISNSIIETVTEDTSTGNQFVFEDNCIRLKINNNDKLILQNANTNLNTDIVNIKSDLTLGSIIKYQKVNSGYDLYVNGG